MLFRKVKYKQNMDFSGNLVARFLLILFALLPEAASRMS
jgi:hypothetical protein